MSIRVINSFDKKERRNKVMGALRAVAMSGRYSEGAFIFRLERMFGSNIGKHSVAFNSCGSALYTMFRYYREQGHRTVAVQNNTFYATAAMALEAGLKVVLIDSSPNCPSMGIDSLKSACSFRKDISIVCLTHVGGWVAQDYAEIAEFCTGSNRILVEDCAHAVGLQDLSTAPGKLGDAACWSFYPTKAIPVGEGGMLTTHDADLREFSRRFNSYGKYTQGSVIKYDWGHNFRISEWNAAIAVVQLECMAEIIAARRRDAEALQSIAQCLLPGPSNFYKYPVAPDVGKNFQTTGGVYQLSDQLVTALPKTSDVDTVNLVHSSRWAMNHVSLPVGEGIYDGMDEKQILEAIKK